MQTLAPDATVDRYRVEGLLGEGGMARVYRVRHTQLGTIHALKVLTVSAAGVRERLLQEGRVQASLRHPNIVAVTDVIDVDGAPGLVMEFVDGPTLSDLIASGPLSIEQVDALADGILAGVEAAHAEGLVHRDLKPDNILLQPMRGGLLPKVADFGVVKVLGASASSTSRTRTGIAMGTPAYMSPEQIRDTKHVDARSDIFSMGAILYEMLTGRRAFPQDDVLRCFNAIVDGLREPVNTYRPDAPARMVEAVEGALRTDADARIPDCSTLRRAWNDGRAVLPAPPPAGGWSAADIDAMRPRLSLPPAAADPPPSQSTWGAEGEPEGAVRPPTVAEPPQERSALDTLAPPPPSTYGFGVALGVAGVLAVGAVAAWVGLGERPAPETTVAQEPAVETEPRPAPSEPVTIPTPAPDAPAVPAPAPASSGPASPAPAAPRREPAARSAEASARATPSPAPAVTDVAPAPAPSSAAVGGAAEEPAAAPAVAAQAGPPPGYGFVRLTGDARSLYLRSSAGNFPAGQVPAGTYTMSVFFEGTEPMDAGTLVVGDGQTREVKCASKLLRCTPR